MKRNFRFIPYISPHRIGFTIEYAKTRYLTDIGRYCTDYTFNIHVLIFGFALYWDVA
jgi:hypothetical protein